MMRISIPSSQRSLRALLFIVAAVLAAPFQSAHPATPEVYEVRFSYADGRTRIVVDCSAPLTYEIIPFHNPERVAVNLKGVKASDAIRGFSIADGVVEKVRINRLSWGSQIVFDLRANAEVRDFALGRTETKRERLVFDVRKSTGTQIESKSPIQPIIVVIDAGHGGRQPGTIGKYKLVEKEVVLDIAQRIAQAINRQEGYKAVLTRNDDRFLALERRTEIAREQNADAFVSIHCNSAEKSAARGAEVFFLSPSGARDKASKLMSDKQEAARELGLDEPQSDDVLHMILDVNQQSMMLRSSLLAEAIIKSMRTTEMPVRRGIKQRGFGVLKTITLPSVLVEVGFISNAHDAKELRTASGRQDVAESISKGIVSFFRQSPPLRGQGRKVRVHHVKRGDSLWEIAKTYNTTITNLRKINKLGTSSKLHVGQKILIYESK